MNRKEYKAEYYKNHKREYAEYRKTHKKERAEYREKHKKRYAEYQAEYRRNHATEKAKYQAEYRKAHKKERAEYRKNHERKIAKYMAEYQKTQKGKELSAKQRSRRQRDYGFELLFDNPFKPPIEYHHISNAFVLAIPRSIHRAYLGYNHREQLKPIVEKLYGISYVIE